MSYQACAVIELTKIGTNEILICFILEHLNRLLTRDALKSIFQPGQKDDTIALCQWTSQWG